mgnify:CR=1 FL=1|tara:strand:+ start:522 stop:764 length:243 start_codon:yes stop_codon:yes gene_type:complete
MKQIKIKPNLVDKNLLNPIKKIEVVVVNTTSNFNFYSNLIGIMVVIIFGMILYQRYINKEKIEIENQNRLINLHMYVNGK